MGIAALILGIISVVILIVPIPFSSILGIICGLIAIILGVVARKNPEQKGMGTGGLVCGIIGFILNIIGYVMCAGFLGAVASSVASQSGTL